MNAKNRLIQKLLKVAKKHKILTYPVLALVALISIFSYFFDWSTGAGKRVVAVVMVMVMLVSQSYFLTSSATEVADNEQTLTEQENIQNENKENVEDTESDSEEVSQQENSTQQTFEQSSSEESASTQSDFEDADNANFDNSNNMQGTEESNPTIDNATSGAPDEEQNGVTADNTEADLDLPMAIAEKETIPVNFVCNNNSVLTGETATKKEDGTYEVSQEVLDKANKKLQAAETSEDGYYKYEGWYTNVNCTDDTKVSEDGFNSLHMNNDNRITLYAKRTLVKYKVTIDPNGDDTVEYTVIIGGTEEKDSKQTYYDVPINDGNAFFEIKNLKRVGYDISGAIVSPNGSALLSEDMQTLTVNLTGDVKNQTVKLSWQAGSYIVNYAKSDDDSETVSQSYLFDNNEKWASPESIDVDKKTGYEFSNWKIKDTDITGKASEPMNIEAKRYLYTEYSKTGNTPATVIPEYSYLGIECEKEPIEYQYEVENTEAHIIKGHYKNKNEYGNFEYEITLPDDLENTKTEYGIEIKELKEGGISVSTVEGGPKKTGNIQLQFTITDNSVIKEQEGRQITVTVEINIKPRVVHISKDNVENKAKFTKTYDGTLQCGEGKGFNGLVTDVNGITVNCTGAEYDEKNAGSRTVKLTGCTLQYEGDKIGKESNYVLDGSGGTCSVPGYINQRKVYLKTTAKYIYEREYVRAGETSNPELGVEEDAVANSDKDCGFVSMDDTVKELEKAKEYLYVFPERNDLDMLGNDTHEKEYQVQIRESSPENSNYLYKYYMDDVAKFKVILEDPSEGDNYTIQGAGNDGWYNGNQDNVIHATNGYDEVYTVDGKKIEVLTEEDTVGNQITFQLKDSYTGAFTSYKTMDVKVDLTVPTYVGYTLEESAVTSPGEGLYFPSEGGDITFGNYYNHTINFTIEYFDARSNPKTLYYYFGEHRPENMENAMKAKFNGADSDGYATATFEIPVDVTDKLGKIYFAAEDYAGNRESGYNILSKNGDEWAVEKTAPSISPVTVKTRKVGGELTIPDNDENYYSNCTAYVTAKDTTSGIYGITWTVNGQDIFKRVSETSTKITEQQFSLPINEDTIPTSADAKGQYTVSAVIWDNAKNHSERTNEVEFRVDDVPPVLEITDAADGYMQKAKVTFKTYDALSGVCHIDVYDENNNLMREAVVRKETVENEDGYMMTDCYFETTHGGKYTIVVEDFAGNITKQEINLNKVSSEVPECPEVTFMPKPNENGWIVTPNSKVRITNVMKTANDNMEVTTNYVLWNEKQERPIYPSSITSRAEYSDVIIPGDGVYKLHVWSESLTGVKCNDADNHLYTIQVDSQAPTIDYTLHKGSGNNLIADFTITDPVSGVDKDSIRVMHGPEPLSVTITETEDGYAGTFEIKEVGSYTIQGADMAGNEADAKAFTPMSMKVNAVKNITEDSATLGARIFKGTNDISSASISYRKIADADYTETNALPVKDENGNMTISAVLSGLSSGTDYVFKVVAVSSGNEVLEYEGYFRTIASDEVGITISGNAGYADAEKAGYITVGLFKGSYCIRAMEIDTAETTEFSFYNVPDGSYNLTATDGTYSKSTRVVVVDGKLVYPEDGNINLVLSTMSTSVEVQTDETPDVSADFVDIEDLLEEADKALIEAGGTIEYKLTAKLIHISSIETAALSAMYVAAGNNKVVGAYLDLNLYKISTDENGDVVTRKVSKLGGGANVSVTIPLGDLAGKPGLTVVRIHQDGDTYIGRQLADIDNNPSTYTVTTTQFSTYAVLYDKPEEEPSTEEDSKPETSNKGEGVVNSSNQQTLNKSAKAVEIAAKTKTAKATTTSSSVGSLRSSSTAKTGDEAPVAAVGVIFIMTMGGLVILRRKTR